MKRFHPQVGLTLVFVGIIAVLPLIQVLVEVNRGELPRALKIFKRIPTAANLRVYDRSLEDANWVAAKLRPWAQYIQFAWLKDGGEKALIGRDGWLFYGPGVQYVTDRPGVHRPTTTAEDVEAAVIDLRNQLAARGIQLLVMPTPNKESVYPEKLTRRAGGQSSAVSPETKELMVRLKAAGVEVVDLFELFTTCKATDSTSAAPFYLTSDSHWSPAGVEMAARATARRVLEHNWVKPGSVRYEIKSSPVKRVGDILNMLQMPGLAVEELAEQTLCSQVVRGDTGELYRDEITSEILVLGDSFLRIYQTDEPGAGGFIAHLARELGQPVTSIVNDGGASTLVRQELSRRPTWLANKKVVIWEFVERDIRLGTEGWQHVPLPAATTSQTLQAGKVQLNH
jgi:hypothetical protein